MVSTPPLFAAAETDPVTEKDAFKAQEEGLRTALLKAQYALLEKADRALVIVVAGIDGAGKGATVRLINEWMDPRHIRTLAIDPAAAKETGHPKMWPYWNALPPRGKIGIVFGSWYVDFAREAARKHPRPKRLKIMAQDIQRFEAMLAADGVQVLKLWFHLSQSAQATRIKSLLSRPETAWQVTPADLRVQKKFDRLAQAGALAINLTDHRYAPWRIIPSACEYTRSLETSKTILAALKARLPRVPTQAPELLAHSIALAQRIGVEPAHRVVANDYDEQLNLWQGRLAQAVRHDAFKNRHLILAFEGQDAAGKGGAIRRVVNALDPRQYEIHQISAPSQEELARPYLWRFWRRLPAPGRVVVFDRSWYGRVLVERVEKFAKPTQWRRAYAEINDFEAQNVEAGSIVLKFWLAIDSDEQLSRFKARQHSPFKKFKITDEDWRNRNQWDAYARAAQEMLDRTDTPCAPWHVIDAQDKKSARIEVLRHTVEALESALGIRPAK